MYTFAIIALLGLATVKLVDFGCDTVTALRPLRSLLTFVVAIAAVLALDFSMFTGWKLDEKARRVSGRLGQFVPLITCQERRAGAVTSLEWEDALP